MPMLACFLTLFLLLPQDLGTVTSSFDKKTDFGAFQTYAWEVGLRAYDPVVHKTIVEAMESQMTALGFEKAERSAADVILKYHSVRGSDVELEVLEKRQRKGEPGPAQESILGTLAVGIFQSSRMTTPVWQARLRKPLSEDAATRKGEIEEAVAALFKTYPTRRGR